MFKSILILALLTPAYLFSGDFCAFFTNYKESKKIGVRPQLREDVLRFCKGDYKPDDTTRPIVSKRTRAVDRSSSVRESRTGRNYHNCASPTKGRTSSNRYNCPEGYPVRIEITRESVEEQAPIRIASLEGIRSDLCGDTRSLDIGFFTAVYLVKTGSETYRELQHRCNF